jgi:CHAT domain-containing protein
VIKKTFKSSFSIKFKIMGLTLPEASVHSVCAADKIKHIPVSIRNRKDMAVLFSQKRSLIATVFLVATLLFSISAASASEASRPDITAHTSRESVSAGLDAYKYGDFQQALKEWTKALQDAQGQSDRTLELEARLLLAEAYQALGQHRRAIQILEPAMALVSESSKMERMIQLTIILGRSYTETGDTEQARKLLEESAGTANSSGRPELAASALNNLGNLFIHHHQYPDALAAYEKCIVLAKQADELLLQAQASTNAAEAALGAGNLEHSSELLSKALEASDSLSNSHDKAYLLLKIGQVWQRLDADSKPYEGNGLLQAYAALYQGQVVAESIGDHLALSYALGYQGQVHEAAERFDDALNLTDRAIFAAQRANAPEALYRWEWQAGRLLRTQGDIDGAIARYRKAIHTLQSIRPDLSIHYAGEQSSNRQAIGSLFFELADLLLQRSWTSKDQEAIQDDLIAARDAVEQIKVVELENYFRDDCVVELEAKLTKLDQIDNKTAIFYPILLDERLELLLSLPDGIKHFTVPLSRAKITEEIRTFRKLLEKRTTHQYLPHARQLYSWLIQPMAQDLVQAGIETLVTVPDGPLRTIPLGALHDGEAFLIEKYALAYTPGLQLTDPHPLKRNNLRVLMGGLTMAVQDFPPLPYVSGELEQVHDLYGGTILMNKDYLFDNVHDELEKSPYTVVHLASHGLFSGDARRSFVLTYDGKVTLDRLEQLIGFTKYRKHPVEMLTLSACQTAAGDDRAALGLAGVAVKAGARSALATLWHINDQATSMLISNFYQQLKDPDNSKARALQQAQVSILLDRRYRHPSYWSPFLLIGNWL